MHMHRPRHRLLWICLLHLTTFRVGRYPGICSRVSTHRQDSHPPYLRTGFWMSQCRPLPKSFWDTVAISLRTLVSAGFRGSSRYDTQIVGHLPRLFCNELMRPFGARSKNARNAIGRLPARPVKTTRRPLPSRIRRVRFPRSHCCHLISHPRR